MKWYAKLALMAAAAAVVPACSDGGSSGGGAPAGGNQSLSTGGTGSVGAGGDGNYFEVEVEQGGDLRVLQSGSVNTSFSVPDGAVPYLGTNPRTISVDTTITPTLGVTTNTIQGDAAGNATGLWIKPGVTLTIKPSYDTSGDGTPATGTFERAYLEVDYGVYIEGTLLVDRRDLAAQADGLSPSAAELYLDAQNVVIASSGRITATGNDLAAGADGGNGGNVYIYTDYSIINRGVIDTSGGDGDDGGAAGYIELNASNNLVCNTGTLLALGGTGGAGGGGSCDYIGLYSYEGVFNSGTITATGGNGTTGGGDGAYVEMQTSYGAAVNSGPITTSGGDAVTTGDGGAGGYVDMETYNSFRIAGTITTRGGKGSATGTGGDGGYIDIQNNTQSGYEHSASALGASLNTAGGDGANGGSAGYVYIYVYAYNRTNGEFDTLDLVNFGQINTSGGKGQTNGGSAGDVDMYFNGMAWGSYSYWIGTTRNEVPVVARGGEGTTTYGGDGGDVTIEGGWYNIQPFNLVCTNTASVDMSGGLGATYGGGGGDFYMGEMYGVNNSGSIISSGGAGGSSYGGDAGQIYIESDNYTTNSGTLTANGGASTSDDGGTGGSVYIYGMQCSTASISANGGNGSTGAGDVGGDGGYIEIESTDTISTVGSLTADGGTGLAGGTDGDIWVDGLQVSGQ